MLEQKKLDPRVPIGKKECAIFETFFCLCLIHWYALLRREKTYFTCILLIYSRRARVQILFKSDTKTLDISFNFVNP